MTQSGKAAENWRSMEVNGFIDLIGPLLRTGDLEGEHRYGLQTNENHSNRIGLIHGGVLTSLLDQVIAISAWKAADQRPTATVQMDTRFIGAAKAGDFLESRAILRQATRSLIFVDGDVTCGGRLIATATAVMKILNPAGN